jgi:hypothetical protein
MARIRHISFFSKPPGKSTQPAPKAISISMTSNVITHITELLWKFISISGQTITPRIRVTFLPLCSFHFYHGDCQVNRYDFEGKSIHRPWLSTLLRWKKSHYTILLIKKSIFPFFFFFYTYSPSKSSLCAILKA